MVDLKARLKALERDNRLRHLRPLSGPQGRVIELSGRELLNFSSNDYLGLAAHPVIREAAHCAIDTHGLGAGAARLLVGNFDFAAALEERIAKWLGAESCLLFSSGYHANLAILPTLAEASDRILSDELNHASLIEGCRLSRSPRDIFPHKTPPLDELTSNDWMLTESLFSMDGDWAPIAAMESSAKSAGARLIVDEAHAIGVHGPRGAGLASRASFARIGTMGKAFGSYGAFIVGSHELMAVLRSSARSFMFTTALPAPILAASLAALELITSNEGDSFRASLHSNCQAVATMLAPFKVNVPEHLTAVHERTSTQVLPPGPIFSLELGSESRALQVSAALEEAGLLVQAIRPPTVPVGRSRLRLVITASHTSDDLARLAHALKTVLDVRA